MRARIIGCIAVAAVVTPVLVERPSIAAATTAQVYVTGYVDRGYTASGVYTHPGTCAVDPRVIPLGTYITVQGLGTCHAEDTGSAVIGYHVDIWVPTVAEAYAITGWRTATWDSGASQQVLAYHAVAPTPTATSAPPTLTPRATATTAPSALPTSALATATATATSPATTTGATPTSASGDASMASTPLATMAVRGTRPQRAHYPRPTLTAAARPAAPSPPRESRGSRGSRCHTVYWTTYVRGQRYTWWRTTCS